MFLFLKWESTAKLGKSDHGKITETWELGKKYAKQT